MSVFDNQYFRINKFFLTCTGLWPYLSTGRKLFMRTIVLIVLSLYLIPPVGGIYQVWGKMNLMVECLIPIFTTLACLVWTITYICKEEQLKELLDCIESEWQLYLSGEEFNILQRHGENGRKFTLIYFGCVILTGITYIVTTVSPQILNIILPLNETRPKKLPCTVEYFVNLEENFEYIFVHIFITTVIEFCVLVGCRSTCSVLIEHACGLFANVGHRFKNVINDLGSEKTMMESQLKVVILRDVAFCIELHLRAIEFVFQNTFLECTLLTACGHLPPFYTGGGKWTSFNEKYLLLGTFSEKIETFFSSCFFFIMGLTTILISATLTEVALNLNKFDVVLKFGVYSFGLTVDLFFNNLPAQRLMDFSTSIGDHILEGVWYRLPWKSQKLLLIIIPRGNIPCILTAGKVYLMSFPNFASVLQLSLSYFTLLTSLSA